MGEHDLAAKTAGQSGPAITPDLGSPGKSSSSGSLQGGPSVQRKSGLIQDPSYGHLQGAGDEAAFQAGFVAPLQVDNVSVQTDRSRVGEILQDIDTHTKVLIPAEKDEPAIETKYGALAANTATRASLEVFNDKLDVSAVDTTAFASQYRYSYADYQRLVAEATEYTMLTGHKGADPLATVGDDMANKSDLKMNEAQVGLQRFRAARANMNTAGAKMDTQLKKTRSAADHLQGALYKAKAAAASASGKDAATKLAAVQAEIKEVAGGVAKVVKICSAVAGLAGGGGATGALATGKSAKETGGHTDIDASHSGLATGGTVLDPQEHSRIELMKAMGTDAASVGGGGGGGPEGMAEALVSAIGTYANKGKIADLQAQIVKAAAEEATFNAAGEAQHMVAYQTEMEAEAQGLALLMKTFFAAKRELAASSQALMEQLSQGGGKKGKEQARGVLFVTDADRFLAQVQTSISVGKNQQANLQQAVKDRKALRGASKALEGGTDDSSAQYYYRCTKFTTPGRLWGTNNSYKLDKVSVTFQDHGTAGTFNDVVQGGAGSIEGTGSADDQVANKIQVLEKAQKQVTELQKKVQSSLGLGEPGLNA